MPKKQIEKTFAVIEKDLRLWSKVFDILIPVGTEVEVAMAKKPNHVILVYHGAKFIIPLWLAEARLSASYKKEVAKAS